MKLIDKDALVAEIEKSVEWFFENNDRIYDEYGNYYYKNGDNDYRFYQNFAEGGWNENRLTLSEMAEVYFDINSLKVKEVDLDLITDWFDHIAQIADDRMTLTNQRMTDTHALDEIKCLAKNSSEFIKKHYKALKGE